MSLTTFRRDGSPVATPVSFVADDGHLLVETDRDSYKVQRIRRNDNVTVAACNARGRVLGEPVAAHAAVLPEGERLRAERLIAGHPLDHTDLASVRPEVSRRLSAVSDARRRAKTPVLTGHPQGDGIGGGPG